MKKTRKDIKYHLKLPKQHFWIQKESFLKMSDVVIGEKEEKYMKAKTKYYDAPTEIAKALQEAEPINDFLPPPEQLILKEEIKKVTIGLSTKSLSFFKKAAKDLHVPYQQMIRKVLDTYSERFEKI